MKEEEAATSSDSKELHRRPSGIESAFEAAPIGLCFLDLDFRYVTVNKCFARNYGHPREHFIGHTVAQALPGQALQIIAQVGEALEADGIVEREITLDNPLQSRSPDSPNQLVYLRSAQPIRNENGNVCGVSISLLDITDRKVAEANLRQSEENLRNTVELTPHIPWTSDPSGEVTYISPRWHVLTGGEPKPVSLKDWADTLHPDDHDKTAGMWSHALQTGEPYDAEYRISSVESGWRWVRARAYPSRDSNAQIVRWYGTVEDVHERKLTAMRLEEATEELGRRAQEDHLTGIPNRRRFDEVLGREIYRARRTKLPLALILFDIDHFKQFNDLAGHLAGDECLKIVARALGNVISRPADIAARFGGEEFAMILPDTCESGAEQIAEKATCTIRGLRLGHPNAHVNSVTISAGLAMLGDGPQVPTAECMTKFIDSADAALYQAKANGRNCWVKFTA